MIQEKPLGNACKGGALHGVGLEKTNRFPVARVLGFCGGADAIIRRAGTPVVITLPGDAPHRGSGTKGGPVPTVTIAGETKVTVATVRKITDGDAACYLDLVDDRGRRFEEMAEFDLSGRRKAYLNRSDRLTYGVERVIHEGCMGNPACRKTRWAVMIKSARVNVQ